MLRGESEAGKEKGNVGRVCMLNREVKEGFPESVIFE